MNLHVCAKFGPDRTTGDDVYTVGRIHTHTHTHTHTQTHTHSPIYRYRFQRYGRGTLHTKINILASISRKIFVYCYFL